MVKTKIRPGQCRLLKTRVVFPRKPRKTKGSVFSYPLPQILCFVAKVKCFFIYVFSRLRFAKNDREERRYSYRIFGKSKNSIKGFS